jgi:N-methylhydantoinase A
MAPNNDGRQFTVAVDIGGTFTDMVAVDQSSDELVLSKRPSVPGDFLRGVDAVLESLEGSAVGQFRHGTTVGTNAIIQRNGARTGLITTAGFRDVLLAARASRPDLYDSDWDPPPALVPRSHILTVEERVDYRGEIVAPLSEDSVREAARALGRLGVEAVAICFINSFVNPSHEQRALEIVREELGDVYSCASSAIVPEIREFERTSTTVVNAYLGPLLASYLQRLEEILAGHSLTGGVLVTHSGGGLMSSRSASEAPARVCQSGPAAGVMGGLAVARRLGIENAITLDMGGTSADISVVVDGAPLLRSAWNAEFNIPITFPAVDVVTIGAGGGTIAWIDSTGTPHSGPQSAGASPGPACYMLGGEEPTNTDANVVLNRLRAEAFMGGDREIPLSADAARTAIDKHIATPLELSVPAAASAVLRLSNASMINAIRLMTVQRGLDPRDFSLVAFGGAGPLHAADLALEMGIPEVVVPTYPGLVSAMGALQIDLRHDFVRPLFQTAGRYEEGAVTRAIDELEQEMAAVREREPATEWTVEWHADCRYYGQVSGYLPIPLGSLDPATLPDELVPRFHAGHEREFGYGLSGDVADVEFVNLRAALLGQMAPIALPARPESADAAHRAAEPAYFFGLEEFVATDFVARESLARDETLDGPAVIEEWDSTTVVPPGARARVVGEGEIVIQPSGSGGP